MLHGLLAVLLFFGVGTWLSTAGAPARAALALLDSAKVGSATGDAVLELTRAAEALKSSDGDRTDVGADELIAELVNEVTSAAGIPPRWLPSPAALALTFLAVSGEVGLTLGMWKSPRLRTAVLTKRASSLASADSVFVVPADASMGDPELRRCERVLTRTSAKGKRGRAKKRHALRFSYQHQSWEWRGQGQTASGPGSLGSKLRLSPTATELGWRRVSPPCSRPVDWYTSARGHLDASSVEEATREYGPNSVVLRDRSLTAEFMDRILSPLALWQLFSCVLSVLDGYAKSAMTSVSGGRVR